MTTSARRASPLFVSLCVLVSAFIIDRIPQELWRVPGWSAFSRAAPEQAMLVWKLGQIPLCILAVMAILRVTPRPAMKALGLARSRRDAAAALAFGFACSLPVLGVVLWAGTGINPKATVWGALRTSVGSGLGEEVFFRGLLFLMLYRFARWPFWAAALANALPWVVGHFYQSQETGLELMRGLMLVTFTFTAFGALAAWVLVRWHDNLWMLVAVHGLANLWWYLFAENMVPLFGPAGWVMRGGLLVSAILLTVFRNRLERLFFTGRTDLGRLGIVRAFVQLACIVLLSRPDFEMSRQDMARTQSF